MFSLENSFIRILFAAIIQFVCLITTIFGIIYASERNKWSGVIKFLSESAISLVWLILGSAILLRYSLWGLAAYTIWGTLGIVPFIFPLFKIQKKENLLNWQEMICGISTVLLFDGTLTAVLYYQGVTNGIFLADKFFLEKSLNTVGCFLIFPVILFFMPVFSILALILGTLREKFSGFLKNLLLLTAAPGGFLLFTGTAVWQLAKIQAGGSHSIFSIFAVAAGWVIFMFVPYGFMLWRGRKEKDEMKINNGIAGIWAVNFFMLALCLLGCICRGR